MTKPKKDYFKLPFEVFYSEYIPVTECQFKSDIDVKKFSDIKAMHQEKGGCWGVTFVCGENNGPELYCCITNSHDEAQPPWFEVEEEQDIDFNDGENFIVNVDGDKIIFKYLDDEECDEDSEEYVDIDSMDYCCGDTLFAYHLDQSTPDYIILDADDSRIKVNLDGYVLDENDMPTSNRVFSPDDLDEEKFENYASREFYELKVEWINNVFSNDFPKEKPLTLMDW